MSKNLFHKITIKIPSELIYINKKSGHIKLVPTLTKKGALSKRAGEPSIILKKDDYIIHPEIEDRGTVENYDELKIKNKKPRAPRKKKVKEPEPDSEEEEEEEEEEDDEEEDKKGQENFNIKKYNFDDKMKMKFEVIKLYPSGIISREKMNKIFKKIDDGSIKNLSKLIKFLDSLKEKHVRKRPRDELTIKYLSGMAEDMTDISSFEQKFLLHAVKNKDVVNTLELQNLLDELDFLINNSDDEDDIKFEVH
jgi:hypothetical protein